MKKAIAALLIAAALWLPAANADLSVLARYTGLFSSAALEAASRAKLPEDLQGLTNLEKELYELGFAAGYDAALAPKEETFIVNKKSMKFHKPECSGAKTISENNRLEITATREEMLRLGYEPCGTCKP